MGSIGRNDRCPCGSGLKYKQCCLKKNNLTFNEIESDDNMRIIVKSTYDFIKENKFEGGCHLTSAIMYILLTEVGFTDLEVKTGVVENDEGRFDHSWVEYQGKKIDMAIMNTLQDGFKYPPVFLDKLIGSSELMEYKYGIDMELDSDALRVLNQSLSDYILDGESQNTVLIFKDIAKRSGIELSDAKETLRKYSGTYRVLERK
ncbi:SEC-C domain-containing protein [Anaerocolumna sp. AGMB13025]|uniref:SEC-C domain-containing protein n=1 Tax=Anaerocolumna sp. AGMB13025 TaxID=3039116 RepID=UPI0024200ED2|nr:SEC-C domain-containing protein [Anaerocolumna sp. AGMB13025]WFR58252.1 SEC-C domain-containing protein [Anaerocolumna sp. AGMB13025]